MTRIKELYLKKLNIECAAEGGRHPNVRLFFQAQFLLFTLNYLIKRVGHIFELLRLLHVGKAKKHYFY